MSEWPEHPRLTDVLQRLADDAELREDHRQAVLARFLQTSTVRPTAERRRSRPHRRDVMRGLRLVPTVTAVAMAAVLLLSGLVIASRYLSATGSAIEAGGAPRPDDGVPAPEPDRSIPELTPTNFCQARPAGPLETEFLLTIDDVQPMAIGIQATDGGVLGPGGLSLIDFGDEHDWRKSRQLNALGPTRFWLAFRVPVVEGVDTVVAVIDDIVTNSCQTAYFAAIPADVTSAGPAVSCRTVETGRVLNAVLLIDPAGPPPDCPGTTPTLAVKADLGDSEIAAWAEAYSCRVPSTETLTDGASIVTFDECRHPLAVVVLQRPIDDVWTDSTLTGVLVDLLLQLR